MNSMEMIEACMRQQKQNESAHPPEPVTRTGWRRHLLKSKKTVAEVNLRYGSHHQGGELLPNAGGAYFMKLVVDGAELRELEDYEALALDVAAAEG
jgi:hypothetical protein